MNTITINTGDWNCLFELMDRHEEFNSMLIGYNEDGEFTTTSIFEDHIVYTTEQKNGYNRINVYWRDYTVEELYEKTER